VDAQVNYGNILRDIGKLEDAMIVYKKAMKINPNHELLKQNLAQMQEIAGSAYESLEVEIDAHGDEIESRHSGKKGSCGGNVSLSLSLSLPAYREISYSFVFLHFLPFVSIYLFNNNSRSYITQYQTCFFKKKKKKKKTRWYLWGIACKCVTQKGSGAWVL
jgi:tetratricopeptide (TPR) repeat protein